jgi:hypothetical protein
MPIDRVDPHLSGGCGRTEPPARPGSTPPTLRPIARLTTIRVDEARGGSDPDQRKEIT